MDNILKAYKHCPKCAGSLRHDHENLLKCSECEYEYFINSAPACGVLLKNSDGQILLTKRGIEPFKGTWDTAGGFIGLEESFEEAVARELAEELHVKAKIEKILGTVFTYYPFQGINLPVLTIIAVATIVSDLADLKVDDDVAGYQFFEKNDLLGVDIPYDGFKALIAKYVRGEI